VPTNGAPTDEDVERVIRFIKLKARRTGRVSRVEFSRSQVYLASRAQLDRIDRELREEGLEVDWVYHG
jgi:hypothetical protein